MSASGYIIVALVLAVAITVAIGYLLLANKKRGRSLMGEKPEIQKGESTKPLAETERQPIEEAHTHEAVGEITQEAKEAPSVSEVEGLPDTPEEIQRVTPPKRGGRTHRNEGEKSQTREGSPHHPKPEIVCWEKGREWFLGIEVPEELCKSGEVGIMQDSLRLERDTSRTNCWCLTHAFGKLTVSTVEDPIVLGKEGESYLLFKLSGENRREGRLVTSPSSGEYLVVVPANWKISHQISVSSEQIDMESYQACWHVFDTTDNKKMVFSTPKGEKNIHSKSPRFRMIGPSLNDASYIGPLFVENPPQIGAHDITDWNEVGTIIIGEIGESRWRSEVPLTLEIAVQTLPPEALERGSGWYFLRFYDQHDNLMESLDFRYVRGLKKIKMPRPQPFPLEAGHKLTYVEILHDPECTFETADTLSTDIRIERTDTGTALSIPPNPACDKTRWRISCGSGAKVNITILVERIWWNIGTKTEIPSAWKDRFEPLPKDSFSATSDITLWLRFPAQRWVKKVAVGFLREHAREYPVAVMEQTVCIPLREFEVRDLHRDHFLRVWLERGGKQHEGIVAVVAGLRPDWIGYGRKKSAIAVAMMRKGTGAMEINGFPLTEYFQRAPSEAQLFWRRLHELEPIPAILSQLDVSLRVRGSSPKTKRQLMAVAHALAHALTNYKPELTSMLKREGFGGARVSKSACLGKEGLLNESD